MIDIVKFQKFIEFYDMPDLERQQMGIFKNKDICERIGIRENLFYQWKTRVDNERANPKLDDFEQCMVILRELAFGGKDKDGNLIKPKGLGKDRELYLKAKGYLIDKREDTLKVEVTPADRIKNARELREELRRELEESRSCPLCGFSKVFRHEIRVDTEPEPPNEDREVATLAISSGLD